MLILTDANGSSSNQAVLQVGAQYDSGAGMSGYIDDLMILKGHALYTSNFTPPTAPSGGGFISGSGGGSSSGPDATTCNPGTYNATTGKCEFAYTGSDINWTVPAGVTSIDVKAWGAGGGGGNPIPGPGATAAGTGGAGGYTNATLAVTAGETLTLMVGGGGVGAGVGTGGSCYFQAEQNAAYGGGAGETCNTPTGGGGGGRSAIRRSSDELLTAGGGGGGGVSCGGNSGNGGAGGGTAGQSGTNSGSWEGGGGGSQSAGGTAGTNFAIPANNTTVDGSQFQGGGYSSDTFGGGGGGGGYYGGGPGSNGFGSDACIAGSGGGSGYIGGTGVTNATMLTGSAAVPPNTGDADYTAGTATGGVNTGTSNNGGNGLVVISWAGSGGGSSCPTTATTWDAATKSPDAALTNGNLSLNQTTPGGNGSYWNIIRSSTGKTSGKYYWEVRVDDTSHVFPIGVITENHSVGSRGQYPGSSGTEGIGCYTDGTWSYGNLGGSWNGSCPNTDSNGRVAMVALDIDNAKIWVGVDGTWISGDPATGASPSVSSFSTSGKTFYASAAVDPYPQGSNAKITARFNSASWSYSAPAGFCMLGH